MILSCTCKHAYQDHLYGTFQRVYTTGLKQHRCTVCGNAVNRDVSGEAKKK